MINFRWIKFHLIYFKMFKNATIENFVSRLHFEPLNWKFKSEFWPASRLRFPRFQAEIQR